MSFVYKVKLFNEIAGNKNEFNPRKVALYTGLILEEVCELLKSYNSDMLDADTSEIEILANEFKSGIYDQSTYNIDRVEFLDAVSDIAVVSIGGGIVIGADIDGAVNEVMDSNLSKFPIDPITNEYVVLKDANGKVKKPDTFWKPSLSKFF
jgi:predicted HAD superfamily Cof-like phosphohydrolase